MPSQDVESASWPGELQSRIDALIDDYREALHDCLNGLTEDEARMRLVPSKTTLLGLVKHVTFVEGVWLDRAVSGRSNQEIGIASTVDGSFSLRKSDTIASVQDAHRQRCEASRRTMAELQLDTMVHGRGDRPVWALQLQVLHELAQTRGACRHFARADPGTTNGVTVALACAASTASSVVE